MQAVDSEHRLQLWISIDQVVMHLQVNKVVVDRIIDECHLDFLPRYRFLDPEHLSKVVIYQVLSCRERCVVVVAVS